MRFSIALSFFLLIELLTGKQTVLGYQLNSVYNYRYESSVQIQSLTVSNEASYIDSLAHVEFSVQPVEYSGSNKNILFAKLMVIFSISKNSFSFNFF